MEAIQGVDEKEVIQTGKPCFFSMEVTEGRYFLLPESFPWKGSFSDTVATWEAPSAAIGLELFYEVRRFIRKRP